MIKTARLNLDLIDQSEVFAGAKGNYIDIAILENKEGKDRFGNHGMIVQSISKARRDAGDKGPILGNWKPIQPRDSTAPASEPRTQAPAPGSTQEDDIPF